MSPFPLVPSGPLMFPYQGLSKINFWETINYQRLQSINLILEKINQLIAINRCYAQHFETNSSSQNRLFVFRTAAFLRSWVSYFGENRRMQGQKR